MSDAFRIVDAISETKEDLIGSGQLPEKAYDPFVTNRHLSQFTDTVLYANEMNRWHSLPAKLQHDYLLHSVRKRRRRGRWAKGSDEERAHLISWRTGMSLEKARQCHDLFSDEYVEDSRRMKKND